MARIYLQAGAASFFMTPAIDIYSLGYKEVAYQISEEQTLRCDGTEQILTVSTNISNVCCSSVAMYMIYHVCEWMDVCIWSILTKRR